MHRVQELIRGYNADRYITVVICRVKNTHSLSPHKGQWFSLLARFFCIHSITVYVVTQYSLVGIPAPALAYVRHAPSAVHWESFVRAIRLFTRTLKNFNHVEDNRGRERVGHVRSSDRAHSYVGMYTITYCRVLNPIGLTSPGGRVDRQPQSDELEAV